MSSHFTHIRKILTFAATLVGLLAELISALRPHHEMPLGGEGAADAAAERTCEESAGVPD